MAQHRIPTDGRTVKALLSAWDDTRKPPAHKPMITLRCNRIALDRLQRHTLEALRVLLGKT